MIGLWVVASALGQGLHEQAEKLMNLDFDLEMVEAQVSKKAARSAAPAAEAAAPSPAQQPYAYDEYGAPMYAPPAPQAIERLPLEPNSTLRAVVVHRDRALVTRVREVELSPGPHTVTFEGLPHGVGSEGLAASIERGAARIVSVETVSGAGEVDADERIETIRVDAEELVDELGQVRDRIEALLAQRQYMRSALVPTGATSGLPVREVQQGLAFVAAAERQISHDLREEQDKAEELAEDLHPLLVQLEDPLATGQPVRIDVEVDKAGPTIVALQYTVRGAGWSPSYNARLDPATGMVELEVFGVVAQSSGEDWTDADIALSTADPTGRGALPDLVPWTLGRSGGVGVFGALDLGAGATTAAPAPTATGGVVDSKLDARVEGRGAVVFGIEGKRTIRGDGSPQRLPVGTQKLQAQVELASIPKLAPEVRRRATVRYDGALPLLPGPTSSFVGKDYVGSGSIQAIVPGETLDLAFGTDDRFRVTRQLVTRQQERVGRKSTRYTFRFRTVVANHGDAAATVTLEDQLPLSEDSRIEVRTLELSQGQVKPEEQRVTWKLQVPAHGEAAVDLGFTVTVPDELAYVANEFQMMF